MENSVARKSLRGEEEDSDEDSDKTMGVLGQIMGSWGPWQSNVFLFDLSIQAIATAQTMSIAFTAPTMDFVCVDPIDGHSPLNATQDQCHYYSINGHLEPCTRWTYSKEKFDSTVTSEFDIVCDKAYLASVAQSLYIFGYFVSSLVSGYLSDKYGRIPVLWWSVILEILFGISSAYSYSMVQFIVSRFLMATAVYAKFLTGFTLVMEVAGSDHRSTYGTLARAGKPIGYVLVPVLAYYTRDFRYLQLAITLPQILWIYWLTKLPESPRWLLIQGKMDLAQEVVAQAIRVNGLKVDNLEQRLLKIREVLLDSQKENAGTKYGFGDLFKTPIMRKNSLIMCANWFITVFVYYALSLNVQDLGGNLYINFFISGFVEFPAILFCIVAMKQVGRRKLLSLMMITLFLASTAGIPFYFYQFEGSLALRVTMAMIGKFAATCAFAISYVYSSEIYPTVVRQIGVGTNSATSRLGSMTAPFIKELNRATHVSVSLAIFGIFSLLNALLVLSLPETKGCEIPDTIEQVEEGNFDEKSKLHHGETDGNAT